MNEEAISLIQHFEGCASLAYACPSHTSNGGTWPHLTIGYGHSGPDVRPGMRITPAQARDHLARDLANVETMIATGLRSMLTDFQMGALASLVMNVKPGAFRASGIIESLNSRQYGTFDETSAMQHDLGALTGMAREWADFRFMTFDGELVVHRTLQSRRCAELQLFFRGYWDVPADRRMPQMVSGPAKPKTEALLPGMRSEVITDLHEALGAAGFPVTCGDAYTWCTAEAVKAFQQKHGLKVDGIYGRETAAKLGEVLNG